ncbi:MAG: hypothetical protein V4538_08525 [Bacteroidota bacterium]
MATSNFDKTFEAQKIPFKQKFGVDWNTKPELYIQYLQTIYLSTLAEIANNGLSQILTGQSEMQRSLQGLSQKIK